MNVINWRDQACMLDLIINIHITQNKKIEASNVYYNENGHV